MQLIITKLIWDAWNIDHIARHKVVPSEVETATSDTNAVFLQGYKSRVLVLGKSGSRLLTVVLQPHRAKGEYYVVTARDMAKKERDHYRLKQTERKKMKYHYKKKNQIPKFASVQEEAEFWDTHDAGDYLTEFKEIKAVYDPSGATKTTISVRLDEGLKTQLKRVADQYDISTSSLVRMWVVDRLRAIS